MRNTVLGELYNDHEFAINIFCIFLCVVSRLYPKLDSGASSISSGQESSSTTAHLQTQRQHPVVTSSGDSRATTYNPFNTVQQVSQQSRYTTTVGSPLFREFFQGKDLFNY